MSGRDLNTCKLYSNVSCMGNGMYLIGNKGFGNSCRYVLMSDAVT